MSRQAEIKMVDPAPAVSNNYQLAITKPATHGFLQKSMSQNSASNKKTQQTTKLLKMYNV